MRAAWTRLLTSSAVRMRLTWALTVLSRMVRRAAMLTLAGPAAAALVLTATAAVVLVRRGRPRQEEGAA